jgi:hypothetical protein
MGVERQPELAHRHAEFLGRNLDMRHHAEGVHAGIGATRSVESARMREQPGQGLFEDRLDTHANALDLPPRVGGPVIGNHQLEFHRQLGCASR